MTNKTAFLKQTRLVSRLITKAKRTYFRNLISSCQNQPKKLWHTMDSLLGRNRPSVLPNSESPSILANSFLKFFNDKITQLYSSIPPVVNQDLLSPLSELSPPNFSNFEPCTINEIRNLILTSSDATCSLDIIPTRLLKTCADALAPPIAHLINLSLSEGVFPDEFKHAIILPLLKKPSLPKDDLSSYRPISNLNFISKILEKVIKVRLNKHLESFPSLSQYQSAYRKYFSTETALLRIQNDLNLAKHRHQVSALLLLDLSAAFDTIDHDILISRLSSTFGISNSALSLLTSYLTGRSQSVCIDQTFSPEVPLLHGVPQGSVLGPLLFTLYTTPLSELLDNSSVQFHLYADDTQLYISFDSSDSERALRNVSDTLDLVYKWFCVNRLSVNPNKTEYLLIGDPKARSEIVNSSVTFQNHTLCPSESARNLGVIFDSNLDFKDHISAVCRASFFHIRQLRQIRSSLDKNSAIILANSIVHSKLDYCNSLLYGLPDYSTIRLQRVQNSLARVVCKSSKFKSDTNSLLKNLHWLPIPERIIYKIAVLTFKTRQFAKPSYLFDIISSYEPCRTLRSSGSNLLTLPDIRSKPGRRSFTFAAPKIWNSLRPDLRFCSTLSSFCSGLKTYLFPELPP